MRFLSKYPITAEEVLVVLEAIPQDNPPGNAGGAMVVGGVNDLIRRGIIDHLSNPKNMAALLEDFRIQYGPTG